MEKFKISAKIFRIVLMNAWNYDDERLYLQNKNIIKCDIYSFLFGNPNYQYIKNDLLLYRIRAFLAIFLLNIYKKIAYYEFFAESFLTYVHPSSVRV